MYNLVDEAFPAGEPFQRDRLLGSVFIGSGVSVWSVVVSRTSRWQWNNLIGGYMYAIHVVVRLKRGPFPLVPGLL